MAFGRILMFKGTFGRLHRPRVPGYSWQPRLRLRLQPALGGRSSGLWLKVSKRPYLDPQTKELIGSAEGPFTSLKVCLSRYEA